MTRPQSTSGHDVTIPSDAVVQLDDAEATLANGTAVGEYEVTGKLGEGGFGTVYRALHPLIGKTAAVKVLSREFSANPEMVSRFVAEARAANTIRHKNIIDIFNFGRLEDGRHYFVMELLDGASFDQFLKEKGALEPPFVLAVMRSVARALTAAHDKGIVHRDLKPDNIFLTFDEDDKPVPKLLDFGIAKLLGDATAISGHKTRTGAPVGTPHYMAPEQCLGEEVDERVDVYAFGVVCFEALTGEAPFVGKSFLELMNKQTTADRPAVSERLPSRGEFFDEAIQRMMAIEREERPQTIVDAYRLLEDAVADAGFDVDASLTISATDRHIGSAHTAIGGDSGAGRSGDMHTTGSKQGSDGMGRALLLVGGVLGLGVVAYVASGSMSQPTDGRVATASATATSAATQQPTAAATATGEASAPPATSTQSAEPSSAKQFVVGIEVSPANVKSTVYRVDGTTKTRVPTTEGAFVFDGKAGDDVKVAVRAPGYLEATKTLVLGKDDKLDITLRRRPASRLNKDLEDPFQ